MSDVNNFAQCAVCLSIYSFSWPFLVSLLLVHFKKRLMIVKMVIRSRQSEKNKRHNGQRLEPFYLNLSNLLSQTAVEISTLRILIAPLISSNSSYWQTYVLQLRFLTWCSLLNLWNKHCLIGIT
jgi:hypothetical protein